MTLHTQLKKKLDIHYCSVCELRSRQPGADAGMYDSLRPIQALNKKFGHVIKAELSLADDYNLKSSYKGRHQLKKIVFFRALPELPNPPPMTQN